MKVDKKTIFVGTPIALVYTFLSGLSMYLFGSDGFGRISICVHACILIIGAIIGFVFGSGVDNIASGIMLAIGSIHAFMLCVLMKI